MPGCSLPENEKKRKEKSPVTLGLVKRQTCCGGQRKQKQRPLANRSDGALTDSGWQLSPRTPRSEKKNRQTTTGVGSRTWALSAPHPANK